MALYGQKSRHSLAAKLTANKLKNKLRGISYDIRWRMHWRWAGKEVVAGAHMDLIAEEEWRWT